MASYLPSPFTTQVWGMSGYGLNRLPSIKDAAVADSVVR